MKRKAFTLIELMIVIAVIGITVESFWGPGKMLLGIDRKTQTMLDENQNLLAFYQHLKRFNLGRTEITSCEGHQIVFSDGSSLYYDRDLKEFYLKNAGEEARFKNLLPSSPFRKLNSRTYSFFMQINGEQLNTVWRCGQ
ncbi:MAG: type IV pilin protein [Candidatus Rifleibacteriota bacterium]